MKYCYNCDKTKEDDEFGKNASTKTGLSSYCLVCERDRIKQYKKLNPEIIKEQKLRYRIKYKDRIKNAYREYYSKNKDKYIEYRRKYNQGNRENIKSLRLQKLYGIGIHEYLQMCLDQDNKCAICNCEIINASQPLAVDHDHTTGDIRGLLCLHCNLGLGNFQDNIELLKNAIEYLKAGGFHA